MFFQRLHDQTVESPEALAECRADLQYLANKTVSTKPDLSTFPLSPEHMKTLNDLKRNKDIIITRPDKGRATVVLHKTDYVDKMMTILTDEAKFQKLGPTQDHDRTFKIETELQNYLKSLLHNQEISETAFNSSAPIGSTRPRMYGVPKIHKDHVPMRPILSVWFPAIPSVLMALSVVGTCPVFV